jgi:hypothetical protein
MSLIIFDAEPRAHAQLSMKQALGALQPVTMIPWSGTLIDDPQAPAATTSAPAAARTTPNRLVTLKNRGVPRMGRHLAVASRKNASSIHLQIR